MKKILFYLLIICCYQAKGQDLSPSLIAITVSDIDQSSKWYCENLEMEVDHKMEFPEYDSLRIYFLKGKKFQLELLEKKTSFSIKNYVPDYSINNSPLIGFSKVAFKTDNLIALYKKLKENKVDEVLGITEDNTFNNRYFIIRDPDGNIFQFIEDRK